MKKIHALSLTLFLCLLWNGKTLFAQIPNLVISEIMYNPPEDGADSLEFIEIYNNENTEVDLGDIYFSEGINYSFSNQVLAAQSFIVVAKDSVAFQNVLGVNAFQWTSGTLSNTGETVELRNANDEVVDLVVYENIAPWSTAADGQGASLVLCDMGADNNNVANWESAYTATGFVINEKEIIANPNAASDCPIGPVISFMENSITIIEDDVTIDLQVIIEGGNANSTAITFDLNFFSSGTLGDDFLLDETPPTTIVFPAGLEKDTQVISIDVLEDASIEPNEILIFELNNPTNNAIVDPMHATFEILIEDDDSILPDIVISEVMYNPPEEGVDSTEFIELYNNDTEAINLEGYKFSQGVEFVFPEVVLQSGEYIVIARNANAFEDYYGFVPLEWTSGTLVNAGELIELRNFGGSVVTFVEYSNTADWSLLANGGGASLVLCDADLDNNDSANWSQSISPTGIVIDGIEIFADPNMENNCFVPLSPYPQRAIGTMTTIDTEGVVDSLGEKCELQGVVHGFNLNASNGGTQFVLIDENGDGITVYSSINDFGYIVAERDEIIVQGKIVQFNGLIEIIPDTLWSISSNNALSVSHDVTMLDESTESQLVEIKDVSIINPNDWSNTGSTGFNVSVTNGIDTFVMRIDNDVDLFQMPAPNYTFNLTGLGWQYDTDEPYLEGYQILPRYFQDLEVITSNENVLLENIVEVYPNPMDEFFRIKMSTKADEIKVKNLLGQTVFLQSQPELIEEISSVHWESGIYLVSILFGEKIKTIKIVKW